MSFVLLGILNSQAAGAAQAFFLNLLGGASGDEGMSVTSDSSNNIYTLGYTGSTGAGGDDFLFAKYDASGTIQWQRTLGGASNDEGNSITSDSSGNLYLTGFAVSTGLGSTDVVTAKYDSSGTIQWQRVLGDSSPETGRSVALDSSSNVYVAGSTSSTGAGIDDCLIAKYNLSGNLQWQRVLGGASVDRFYAVTVDSSDNVYAAGDSFSQGEGQTDALLTKYNSSGTIQWQRILGGADNERFEAISIDSSDNIYVSGWTRSAGAGDTDVLLTKYNSSGTIQWQRILGVATRELSTGVAIDSADNIYISGWTNSTGEGGLDWFIAKYDSSGTIQWQRTLGATGNEWTPSIQIDSSDNLLVCGYTTSAGAGGDDFLLAKLPNDGSLQGTYSLDGTDYVYQASSLTAATSSLTATTSTLTAATSSLTSATSSLTSNSASLTSETLEIG